MKKLTALILSGIMILTLCACDRIIGERGSSGRLSGTNPGTSLSGLQPDTEPDSLTLAQLRENSGTEISVSPGIYLGASMPARNEDFWQSLAQGYERFGELSGATVRIQTVGNGDENAQRSVTDVLCDEGAAAVMLSPLSDNTLSASVDYALSMGVATFNVAEALSPDAEYYIGPNSMDSGRLAAAWVSGRLADQGQVAIITGMNTQYVYRERALGFEEWIPENGSSLELVDEQNANGDRQAAREIAAEWLGEYPGLRAIFCCSDNMAIGAAMAVREAGSDILVIGIGGSPEARNSIRAGVMNATVDLFPYYIGLTAGECALRVLEGQWMPRVVYTTQAVISAGNVDISQSDLAGWTPPAYISG